MTEAERQQPVEDIAEALLRASKGERILFGCTDYETARTIWHWAREICAKAFNNAIATKAHLEIRMPGGGQVRLCSMEDGLENFAGTEWHAANALALTSELLRSRVRLPPNGATQ